MTKSAHDDVLDAMGVHVAQNADRQIACSQAPTTYTEAVATYGLADVDVTVTDFTQNDFVHPEYGTGRMCTVAGQLGVPVDASGMFTHVAWVDDTTEKLLYVTKGTVDAYISQGSTVDFPAVNICKVIPPI